MAKLLVLLSLSVLTIHCADSTNDKDTINNQIEKIEINDTSGLDKEKMSDSNVNDGISKNGISKVMKNYEENYPIEEEDRTEITNEKFETFVRIKVKNISKKVITNILTVCKELNYVGGIVSVKEINHRVSIAPGRSTYIKTKSCNEVDIKKVRFSDGSTFEIWSLMDGPY